MMLWPVTVPAWGAFRGRRDVVAFGLAANVVYWARLVPELRRWLRSVLTVRRRPPEELTAHAPRQAALEVAPGEREPADHGRHDPDGHHDAGGRPVRVHGRGRGDVVEDRQVEQQPRQLDRRADGLEEERAGHVGVGDRGRGPGRRPEQRGPRARARASRPAPRSRPATTRSPVATPRSPTLPATAVPSTTAAAASTSTPQATAHRPASHRHRPTGRVSTASRRRAGLLVAHGGHLSGGDQAEGERDEDEGDAGVGPCAGVLDAEPAEQLGTGRRRHRIRRRPGRRAR